MFYNIFSIECDDALRFDLDSLNVINITEFKEYHGVNVSVMGYLDCTRVPVSIDIGFGDVIYPDRLRMNFPVLLDMEAPVVYAYSIYSVIAEKFEAFVSLGLANGRYKDFYDIYVLSANYDLDGNELKKAILETFKHRKSGFDDIVAFEADFTEDSVRQGGWSAFIKKKKAMMNVEFTEAIEQSKKLLMPIVETIKQNKEFNRQWNKDRKDWI